MEGWGGPVDLGVADRGAPEPPDGAGPAEPPAAPQPLGPDQPGLVRRVLWWALGPLLTALLTWVSLLDLLSPSRLGLHVERQADLLAVVLTVVLAGATLFRRRWPLEVTLVASVVVVALAAPRYPPTVLFGLAPCLCAAAALYWSRWRLAVEAVVAAGVGVATAGVLGDQGRGFDVGTSMIVLGCTLVVALVARFVRLAVERRGQRRADAFVAERWYVATPVPPRVWPAGVVGWVAVGAGALAVVVAMQMIIIDVTTVAPLAGPDDQVLIAEDAIAGVVGTSATEAGSMYAIGDFSNSAAGWYGPVVRRYDASGELQWEAPVDAPLTGLLIGPPPAIAAATRRFDGEAVREQVAVAWLEEVDEDREVDVDVRPGVNVDVFDDAGEPRWSDRFGEHGEVAVLADPVGLPDGGFAVAGTAVASIGGEALNGPSDAFVRTYGPDGDVRWTRFFGSKDGDGATALASDREGNLYVGGSGGPLEPGGSGAFLAKLDGTGAVRWMRQFGTDSGDVAAAVTVDGAGPAVLSGRTGPDGLDRERVIAFAHDGAERWQYVHDDPGAVTLDLTAIDGRLFLTGCTQPSLLGSEVGDERALVVEIVDGRAVSEREVGTSGSVCILSAAAAPGGRLLVGGTANPNEGPSGGFLVAVATGRP